jgi:hypothetical protein
VQTCPRSFFQRRTTRTPPPSAANYRPYDRCDIYFWFPKYEILKKIRKGNIKDNRRVQ